MIADTLEKRSQLVFGVFQSRAPHIPFRRRHNIDAGHFGQMEPEKFPEDALDAVARRGFACFF